MKWVVSRIPKADNCPPVTAALGLVTGLKAVGEEVREETAPEIDEINPAAFGDADVALFPHWIGRRPLGLDLAAVSKRAAVFVYTGVPIWWPGCQWAETDRFSRSVVPGTGSTSREKESIAAVSSFAVAWSNGRGPELVVGCGHGGDVVERNDDDTRLFVVDFEKRGWDERAVADACRGIALAQREGLDADVMCLGESTFASAKRAGIECVRGFSENTPRSSFVRLWSSASCVLVHNESFGYGVVEALAAGCRVVASSDSELPSCHDGLVERWTSSDDLAKKLLEKSAFEESSCAKRRASWLENSTAKTFSSWESVARKLVVEARRRLA